MLEAAACLGISLDLKEEERTKEDKVEKVEKVEKLKAGKKKLAANNGAAAPSPPSWAHLPKRLWRKSLRWTFLLKILRLKRRDFLASSAPRPS